MALKETVCGCNISADKRGDCFKGDLFANCIYVCRSARTFESRLASTDYFSLLSFRLRYSGKVHSTLESLLNSVSDIKVRSICACVAKLFRSVCTQYCLDTRFEGSRRGEVRTLAYDIGAWGGRVGQRKQDITAV